MLRQPDEKTSSAETENQLARDPGAPEGLSSRAERLWTTITRDWPLEVAEATLLAEALRSLDRADTCRAVLDAEGLVVRDFRGRPHAHPLIGEERKARGRHAALMRQLDLRPEGEVG